MSYPALSELLSRFIAGNPFAGAGAALDSYATTLPRADLVAENNGTTVMQVGRHYVLRSRTAPGRASTESIRATPENAQRGPRAARGASQQRIK